MSRRPLLLTLGFAATALLGYWLATTAAPRPIVRVKSASPEAVVARTTIIDEAAPRFRRENRVATAWHDDEAVAAGALPGQRTLVFKDKAALEEFLKRAGDKVRLLGRLDGLNALRIGFSNGADLASLLTGEEEASLIYPVDVPTPGDGSVQPGAVALGAGLLDWLGITGIIRLGARGSPSPFSIPAWPPARGFRVRFPCSIWWNCFLTHPLRVGMGRRWHP